MLTSVDIIRAALVEVLNASTRPPALRHLPPITYLPRQVQVIELSDGPWEVRYYHRYKNRKPKAPLTNVAALRDIFQAALPDGITVTAVEDHGNYITIFMEVS